MRFENKKDPNEEWKKFKEEFFKFWHNFICRV